MNWSRPSFPVPHHLPEFAQTHVHWVGDAIQTSHPLLPPFPAAFNLSQDQGLFQWVGSSHQVSRALELQHQSFQWMHWWIKIRVLCLQWICSRVESMNKWVNKKIILRGKGKPGSASKVPQGRWNPPLEKVLITALYKDIVRCGFPVRDPVETRESAQM